jgi:V8-like Glu-specific endopeptidase
MDHIDMAWGTFNSQCGATDDRLPSTDPRAGRILPVGCTGWLINDCSECYLTAGHCSSNMSVVEFNVPASSSGGGLNHPSPDDQYAVDAASIQSNGGQGVGDDWAYYGTFPNPNTGLNAGQAQGSTYILGTAPSVSGNDIRITGFGVDSTPSSRNQTQQTLVGPFSVNNGTHLGYATDTEGGNSGSPVIWEQTGAAIGIHTHGGCSSSGGYNSGTNANHPDLQAALANPLGVCLGLTFGSLNPIPSIVPPGVPVDVMVQTSGTVWPGSVVARYSIGGAAFQSVTLSPAGSGVYSGQLPAPVCGFNLELYFSMDSVECGLLYSPAGAPSVHHIVEVGEETLALADDFETNLGWTTQTVGASSGMWQRGVPVNDAGWAYDPTSDGDGSGSCYLTQNASGNTDVDGGSVILTSPQFELSSDSSIRFDYFLNLTETDSTDHLLVEMSSNGLAGPWNLVADITTSGGLSWTTMDILSSQWSSAGMSPSNDARLRFTANDADPQSIVEAGIDGVKVRSTVCSFGSIGSNYCGPGAPNSTGSAASIRAIGSNLVSLNDVTLHADGLPLNQFNYFLTGTASAFAPNPAGSQGNLCLGGTGGRYNQPGNILFSGATGSVELAIDLTAMPTNPVQMVAAGQSWFFQNWHRDQNPSSTSNFTDGLEISFQ